MILVGNQRGNSADLAAHLMSADNERVQLHELRGFVSETLAGAFNESYAISKGTKCRQHLFSLSLNPPAHETVSTEDFEAAIARVENKLGLDGQPRAIVFHEKKGADDQIRRHCHAVWSRIDAERMKAVQLSFTKRKLMEVSKDLYIHHGWDMPRGLIDRNERDPLNFTHKQWQQAKRIGKDPKAIKRAFQDAWALSDSKTAFSHALAEQGYYLARGDRRGFVAVDAVTDEVFAVSKWVGIKTKEVRARLGDEENLSSIAGVRQHIDSRMLSKVRGFKREVAAKQEREAERTKHHKQEQAKKHESERKALALEHENARRAGIARQTSRYRKGLGGLLDRLIGKHSRIREENAQEAQTMAQRQNDESIALLASHDANRKRLEALRTQSERKAQAEAEELNRDAARFEAYRAKRNEAARKPEPKHDFEAAADPLKSRRDRYREKRQQRQSDSPDLHRSPRYER